MNICCSWHWHGFPMGKQTASGCALACVQIHVCADSLLVCADRDELGNPPLTLTFPHWLLQPHTDAQRHFLKHYLAKKKQVVHSFKTPIIGLFMQLCHYQKFTGFKTKTGHLKALFFPFVVLISWREKKKKWGWHSDKVSTVRRTAQTQRSQRTLY